MELPVYAYSLFFTRFIFSDDAEDDIEFYKSARDDLKDDLDESGVRGIIIS